ncbi:DUF6578 domain-containing protein [Rhodococcus sp. NPDC059969]|uniref:DUF6578 domain-containing protein n=1 Tax=Rhodococcus sp. NPDC059969 TaxID=3347018 RepID=UPI003673147E
MKAHSFTEPTPVDSSVQIVSVHLDMVEVECCGPFPVVGEPCSWTLTPRSQEPPRSQYGEFDGWVHGGMPASGVKTSGVVLGILVETTSYVEVGNPKMWLPVDGSETYRRVDASPRWFRRFGDFEFGPQNRIETGLVVELATTRAPFR